MRIAVLGNASSPHTARWARAYSERGHEVHVLSIRNAPIEGVQSWTFRVGSSDAVNRRFRTFLSYLRFLAGARRRLRTIAPDLVHAHYSTTHGVIALVSGARPIVLSVWGSDVVGDSAAVSGFLRLINRVVLRRVDLVTATSRFMIPIVQELAGRPIRVEHVPFGVDADVFSPPVRRNSAASLHIGFVKHLTSKYGPTHLLEAFSRVRAVYPSAKLTMAGDGDLRAELLEITSALGLADAVDFLGRVPHGEVPLLMSGFDVLVNPSVSETFGVVLLEAMASGVPVVATDVGGVDEVVTHRENGLLVPPRDAESLAAAILQIAGDPHLRDSLIAEGLRTARDRYRWSDNVDQMLGLFQELGEEFEADRSVPWTARVAGRIDGGASSSMSVRRTRRLASGGWFAVRNLFFGSQLVLSVGESKIMVDLKDRTIARHLYWHRSYEPDEIRALLKLIPPGTTAIDVGANLGVYTLALSRAVGDGGRVLAVEPEDHNLELLTSNLKRNDVRNVTVVAAAGGDIAGTASLLVDSSNFGGHTVQPRSAKGEGLPTLVVRIDDLVESGEQVSVVKIDVEGREPEVLHGMSATVDEHQPVIQFEVNRSALERAGHRVSDLTMHPVLAGYRLHRVAFGILTGIRPDEVVDLAEFGHFNVIAIRSIDNG